MNPCPLLRSFRYPPSKLEARDSLRTQLEETRDNGKGESRSPASIGPHVDTPPISLVLMPRAVVLLTIRPFEYPLARTLPTVPRSVITASVAVTIQTMAIKATIAPVTLVRLRISSTIGHLVYTPGLHKFAPLPARFPFHHNLLAHPRPTALRTYVISDVKYALCTSYELASRTPLATEAVCSDLLPSSHISTPRPCRTPSTQLPSYLICRKPHPAHKQSLCQLLRHVQASRNTPAIAAIFGQCFHSISMRHVVLPSSFVLTSFNFR
jgi:hypothetical protein